MPDKKLTDSEIVKALKQCSDCNADLRKSCNGCLLLNYFPYCTENGIDLGVDLINRLQDKNKAYKYYYDECLKDLKKANTENERLKYCNETNISSIATLHERLKTAKAEAYKEFAEKSVERVEKARKKYQKLCKEQGEEMEEHMNIHFNGITKIINNLLKELVGDNQ